jgi:subtilisin-like proprotein convertase family protein
VALSTFDGAKPDGAWRLWVYDDNGGGVGNVDGGWTLEITAKVKDKNTSKKRKGR